MDGKETAGDDAGPGMGEHGRQTAMGGGSVNRAPAGEGTSLMFGTSGLRGLARELNGPPARAYARAFVTMIAAEGAGPVPGGEVLVGRDLRESSPDIARWCCAGIRDAGLVPVDCGEVPTPALAYHGMRTGRPAIMVTGSHIPEDRNGLKFYRTQGEIDKRDESAIVALHGGLDHGSMAGGGMPPPAVRKDDALGRYRERYTVFFGPGALAGLTVGIYQHASVARDLLASMVEALGARPVPLGRADRFVSIDTEALRPEDERLLRQWASRERFDAIVSTDGDGDRPLVADESGRFVRGDLLGAITARFLGADTVVSPVTSNSGLEDCGAFAGIVRTRVGSPYVIEGMAEASRAGARPVIGFEANGGVLLGHDIERGEARLAALPTRDAMLPILCALAEIKATGTALSGIAVPLRFKAAASDRLRDVPPERSRAFMERLREDPEARSDLMAPLGGLAAASGLDGLRMTGRNGDSIHFRPSGNAPELRVYVEAGTPARAADLLARCLSWAGERTR